MTNHSIYTLPDEVLAQSVGIAFAREIFHESQDLKQQDIAFSWGTYGDTAIRIAVSNLPLYFSEVPSNLLELKKITKVSFSIEAKLLVESAGESLNTVQYPVDEIRTHLRQYFDRYYDQLKRRFKRDFGNEHPDGAALDWQIAFTNLHTPTYVYNQAVDYLDRYVHGKAIDPSDIHVLQVDVRQYLRKLFLGGD